MIFECEHYAAFFGARQTTFDAINHPLEAFLFSVAGQHWFDATLLHQLVKIFDRAPTASIDSEARDTHRVTDFDALLRVLDFARDFRGIWTEKSLVRGKANEA